MSNEDIRDELAALRAEVADLRGALADQASGTVAHASTSTVGRRAALGAAGAAIVGAVVGTSASPAAAAVGTFNTGQENTATGPTFLVQETPAVSSNVLQAADRSVPLSAFPSSIGAYAYKENRNGLYAFASSDGFGLVGWGLGGTARGAHLRGTAAPLNMRSEGAAPVERDTPTPGTRSDPLVGDVIFDTNKDLWLCVDVPIDNPAIYRRLAGENTTGGLRLNLPNTRAFDSRAGQAPLDVPKGKLSGTFAGSIDLFNGVAGAEVMNAALINITVTRTEGSGFVQVWDSGGTQPETSSINWTSAGTNIANTTVVPTSADGKVSVFVSGQTDLIIDLIGWFV